eukprot:5368420-Amphidinium_carterae.1
MITATMVQVLRHREPNQEIATMVQVLHHQEPNQATELQQGRMKGSVETHSAEVGLTRCHPSMHHRQPSLGQHHPPTSHCPHPRVSRLSAG